MNEMLLTAKAKASKTENIPQKKMATASEKPKIDKFVIRLPEGVRKKIQDIAKQNCRSMNSQILLLLEKFIQKNALPNNSGSFSGFDVSGFDNSANNNKSKKNYSDSLLIEKLRLMSTDKKNALLALFD